MMRSTVAVAVLVTATRLSAQPTAPLAHGRTGPPPRSSIAAGAFYDHVTNGFGSWTGGYLRAVLAGSRDVFYLDAKAQEAFQDRGVYGSLANVHNFGTHFYTQLGVAGGTGKYVLPELRLDGSVTLKLGNSPPRAVLLTAGGTYVRSKSIYRDKALFGSLAWYPAARVLLEAGGRLNWSTPGPVRSARVSGAMTVGRAGAALLTFRGSAGTEGYQLTSTPATLQKFRSQEAALSWQQWLAPHVGFAAAGEWYHNPFYTRAGGSLGLFYAW
jgi:YaiO family outer membrane protein